MPTHYPTPPRLLVIGVGNADRGDDAVGLIVAQRLKEKAQSAGNEISYEPITILEQSGQDLALIESWKEAETVIVIDAIHSGAKPGTLQRFDAQAQPIPAKFFHHSTHTFSVVDAIELARVLDLLPPRLIIYGIEGKTFKPGAGLSWEVEKAIPEVVEQVLRELYINR
ncbi:MAG: hydrogenase maturation protease [candidate division KSB1 bacterium]|nr:hydrogenase maturation protease [candidate division KSB1 bacterium]